ncbi:hypothetical protein CRENBAI_006258 [Crenichthys baileyi]|uniref:Uncharacterized protein n=1 Tax=Crenichthys baileyi TaxID=28760 RepID=A0AAV9S0C5_9TELE
MVYKQPSEALSLLHSGRLSHYNLDFSPPSYAKQLSLGATLEPPELHDYASMFSSLFTEISQTSSSEAGFFLYSQDLEIITDTATRGCRFVLYSSTTYEQYTKGGSMNSSHSHFQVIFLLLRIGSNLKRCRILLSLFFLFFCFFCVGDSDCFFPF